MKNKKMFTKLAALVFAGAMMVSLGACGTRTQTASQVVKCPAGSSASEEATSEAGAPEVDSASEEVVGGWDLSSSEYSLDKHEDAKKALDKALEGLTGADYEPVAYLGSQVVAGTNYCILCKITPVVPNAEPSYSLVYVYEDLDGKCEITSYQDIEIGGEDVIGGADSAVTDSDS